jgi:hypothetical protein
MRPFCHSPMAKATAAAKRKAASMERLLSDR